MKDDLPENHENGESSFQAKCNFSFELKRKSRWQR